MEESSIPPKKRSRWPFILALTFVLILGAMIVVPNFVRAHTTKCLNACVNNLRQIDGAKEQWALEHKLTNGTPINVEQVNGYIKGGAVKCPAGGTYTYGNVDQPPVCSISGHTLG